MVQKEYCVVSGSIHTNPTEGLWKFQQGGGGWGVWGVAKENIFRDKDGAKFEFPEGQVDGWVEGEGGRGGIYGYMYFLEHTLCGMVRENLVVLRLNETT